MERSLSSLRPAATRRDEVQSLTLHDLHPVGPRLEGMI